MFGCSSRKRNENVPPLGKLDESHIPASLVVVCATVPMLDQVTVSPGLMVSVGERKSKSTIDTAGSLLVVFNSARLVRMGEEMEHYEQETKAKATTRGRNMPDSLLNFIRLSCRNCGCRS